jgi:alkylation response protein AidB-like acyl-CoA dehydrogenase
MTVSFDLTDGQRELQSWLHGFAVDVIRPAAHEYDETEEFPWAVLQEAVKADLLGGLLRHPVGGPVGARRAARDGGDLLG